MMKSGNMLIWVVGLRRLKSTLRVPIGLFVLFVFILFLYFFSQATREQRNDSVDNGNRLASGDNGDTVDKVADNVNFIDPADREQVRKGTLIKQQEQLGKRLDKASRAIEELLDGNDISNVLNFTLPVFKPINPADRGHVSRESLIEQRNQLSTHLDKALQALGQLQCNSEVDTGEREASGGQVTKSGAWCRKYSSVVGGEHLTDTIWIPYLSDNFKNQSVGSFGDGPGMYKMLFDATGKLRVYDAYDGAPFAEEVSDGRVKHLDLSVEQFGLPVYDWIISLEVAEHIPPEHEDAFLSNLARHARCGILMSWANPGQGGFYHLNMRPFDYVKQRMQQYGFTYNEEKTEKFIRWTSYPHLHDGTKVYVRTMMLPETVLRDMA